MYLIHQSRRVAFMKTPLGITYVSCCLQLVIHVVLFFFSHSRNRNHILFVFLLCEGEERRGRGGSRRERRRPSKVREESTEPSKKEKAFWTNQKLKKSTTLKVGKHLRLLVWWFGLRIWDGVT